MEEDRNDEFLTYNQLRTALDQARDELAQMQKSHSALTLRIQKIITSFPSGLIIVNSDGLIEAVNKQTVAIFDYTTHEMVDRPFSMLFPEKEPQINSEPVRILGLRKSGEQFTAEIVVNSLEMKASQRLFVNVQDITERHRLERLRAELVSMVSHDIRAPLTGIFMVLDRLRDGELGSLTDSGERNVELARTSVMYLTSVVKNLLDAEKIETSGIEIAPAVTTIGTIVKMAVDTANGAKDDATIEIETQYTNDVVKVDETRIVQILINLLSNACKYSPKNSIVKLIAGIEGLNARFEVTDSGPGIPDDMHHQIFERFKQLEQHKAIKVQGFGLGLAICKYLVVRHGGKIWVESEPEKGCRFIFTVPIEPGSL